MRGFLGIFVDVVRSVQLSLTHVSTWTTLGAIGGSYVGRSTILAPLIGYLIIFNPSFVSFFQSDIPGGLVSSDSVVAELHAWRLSFLYFGLLLLGTGMALYALACPEQIRRYGSASNYVSEMESVWSPPLVRNSLDGMVRRFLALNSDDDTHPISGRSHPSFPDLPSDYLHQLIARIYRDIEGTEFPGDMLNLDPPGTLVQSSPFYFQTSDGYFLTNDLMRAMHSGRTVDRHFSEYIYQEAVPKRREVFFVEYFSLNYSLFWLRSLVLFLYTAGIGLLLVPTLTTSALVLAAI